ncbi:MAG: NlpC/P60 family protein [Chloroflexi bacterium]|nr:NlpC/P60 family protein [Chloroflexota bacterium]
MLEPSRLRALAVASLAALVVLGAQPPTHLAAVEPPAAIVTTEPSPSPEPIAPQPAATPEPIATPQPTASPDPAASAAPEPVASPAPATRPAPRPTVRAIRADRVVAIALAERGSRWAYGASGPTAFDCSGLVHYAFQRARALDAIGGGRLRSGSAMLRWARARGLTGATGRRGDIAVWGNGAHVGIYLGNGRAVSTLVSGVRVHGLRVLTTRFTTFIHTGLADRAGGAVATAPARPAVIARRSVAVAALHLRTGPGTANGVIRTLQRGTRLGVVRLGRDRAGRAWYRVVVGSRIGWVAAWLTRPAS